MKQKISVIILFLISIFLIFPSVIAIETTISIKAPANHELTITVLDPNSAYYSLKGYPDKPTGGTGDVQITYSGDEPKIDLSLILKKDGRRVFYNRLNKTYTTGSVIALEISNVANGTGEIKEISKITESNTSSDNTNETANETIIGSSGNNSITDKNDSNLTQEEQTIEGSNKERGISGLTTFDFEGLFSGKVIRAVYIGLGITALAILLVVFLVRRGFELNPFNIYYKGRGKFLEIVPRRSLSETKDYKRELNNLRELQIREAEKKLDEVRKELERLRRSL